MSLPLSAPLSGRMVALRLVMVTLDRVCSFIIAAESAVTCCAAAGITNRSEMPDKYIILFIWFDFVVYKVDDTTSHGCKTGGTLRLRLP